MRLQLDIDDDVLKSARRRAQSQRCTVGAVISSLAREALEASYCEPQRLRNGVPLLPAGLAHKPVTLAIVREIDDEVL